MITLHTKNGRKVGNAILFGGDTVDPVQAHFHGVDAETPFYLVETDFGNQMRLTWPEIEELFTIGPVTDYKAWCQRRRELQNQTRTFNDTAVIPGNDWPDRRI